MRWFSSVVLAAFTTRVACGITLDPTSQDSIKSAAKTIADRMLTYYNGGVPGQVLTGVPARMTHGDLRALNHARRLDIKLMLYRLSQAPVKYYWWECGEMFLNLIDYWYYTGDSSYNALVTEGMQFQVGQHSDFMPTNQTKQLGNDDQVFWAFASLAAAEFNFPDPPASQPSWLALAQAVFTEQIGRWDMASCNGGLKWQIFSFNTGYDYKNSASNMGLFNLAARLFAYTHNSTYSDWANRAWDWQASIGLVSTKGEVFDGSDDLLQCKELDHVQWSYTSGMALHGAAAMYSALNGTGNSSLWADRVNTIWKNSASTFFVNNILAETACETNTPPNCNIDQLSFRSSYSRFIAMSTKLCPWLSDQVIPLLASSASAAVKTCTGQPGGDSCGSTWLTGSFDGSTGLGEMMSTLGVVQANLIKYARNPVTNTSGGTSVGDNNAGTVAAQPLFTYPPLGTGDRAGAGILTAIVISATIGMVWWACK